MSEFEELEDVYDDGLGLGKYELRAFDTVKDFFESHSDSVFFGRQIEVIHEDIFFHWVTNRALRLLVENKVLNRQTMNLKWGGTINIYWHFSLRYYKRPAAEIIGLVEKYSDDKIGSFTGAYCELLVVEGFSKLQFINHGRNINSFQGKKWSVSGHDLDMIVERDGIAYGIEVKNTLPYIEKEEYEIKVKMCLFLGIRPLFVNRMLPKNWSRDIIGSGGFCMILKHLIYPEILKELAKEMKDRLMLPVDTPKSLWEGTLKRFEKWHKATIGRA